jgi:hypothetical protein
MAFSQSLLIQRVRDLLMDAPWATPFTGTVTSGATTIPVPDGTLWDVGAIGEFQDNGEQFYTRSVSGNNLTVFRGYNGTTAAAHDGSVTPIVVYRDPTFTYKRIQDSIELITQSVWPYVWKKVTTTITPVGGVVWYNLASDAMGLINVSQVDTTDPTKPRYYVYGSKGSRLPVGIKFNVPTNLAASGTAIQFPRGFATINFNVQVDYAAKLTATVVSGNYQDINEGILAEMVAHGAAARLGYLSEVPRVTQQDTGMADSSVQPGMRTRMARDLWAQFLFLRSMYHDELRRIMPIMGGGAQAMTTTYTGNYGFVNPPYP